MLSTILLLTSLSAAALTDLRSRRIPNSLTVSAALLGLLLSISGGAHALKQALIGLVLGLLLGVFGWLFGAWRAGDAKLIAATGAIMGAHDLINALVWTFIAAALIGGAILLKKGVLLARLRRLLYYIRLAILTKQVEQYRPGPGEEGELPFAVALLCGAIGALLLPVW